MESSFSRELIDAFPPGPLPSGLLSGDWGVAESTARHGDLGLMRLKVERVDRAVGRAMEQVSLPAGLAERLLAGLQAARMPATRLEECDAAEVPTSKEDPTANGPLGVDPAGLDERAAEAAVAGGTFRLAPRDTAPRDAAPRDARVGRRRWLACGSAAAALAGLAAALAWLWVPPPSQPMNYEDLIACVGEFHTPDQPAEGNLLKDVPPPAEYPYPSAIDANAITHWRTVPNVLGRGGVAYELTNKRGKRATLYVVDLKSGTRPMATSSLPLSPPQGIFTSGRTTGAWADAGRLYVLVVEGDTTDYETFLRRQGGFA